MRCNSPKNTVKSVRPAGARARPVWAPPRKAWPNTWQPTLKNCNSNFCFTAKGHRTGGLFVVLKMPTPRPLATLSHPACGESEARGRSQANEKNNSQFLGKGCYNFRHSVTVL